MSDLIFIGGLPGSGKSQRIGQLQAAGWKVYDDFQAGAYNNSSQFERSGRYSELIADLKNNHMCVVSDIRVVVANYRDGALSAIRRDAGKVRIEWSVFANDPEQCVKNVLRDSSSRPPEPRLRMIREFTVQYSVPESVVPIPVWRGE